jgi:hypothetical protein
MYLDREESVARTKADQPEPLFECVEGFASEWLDLHASDEFPMRFCRKGTLLRESHPVVKAHPWAFAPARAHTVPVA